MEDAALAASIEGELVAAVSRVVAGIANVMHPGTVVIADSLGSVVVEDLTARLVRAVHDRLHPGIAAAILVRPALVGPFGAVRAAGVIDPPKWA